MLFSPPYTLLMIHKSLPGKHTRMSQTVSPAAVPACNSKEGNAMCDEYLQDLLEQLGHRLEGRGCVVVVSVLQDRVHHLGVPGAHRLVQNWETERWKECYRPVCSHWLTNFKASLKNISRGQRPTFSFWQERGCCSMLSSVTMTYCQLLKKKKLIYF